MNLTSNAPPTQTAEYLRTLPSIRERCTRVFDLAKDGKLEYFNYHPDKEQDVTAFCVDIIKRDFGSDFSKIPPHGRWRHMDTHHGRIEPLVAKWASHSSPPDKKEAAKRLIDLFMVSVLLDAGAGLGVAAVHMFEDGLFSSDPQQPYRVDAEGLSRVTVDKVAAALQITADNPLVGLEGRTSLLTNLSTALKAAPEFFGTDARPGNLIDFLEAQSLAGTETKERTVPVAALWHALITGLQPIWPPGRGELAGVPLGDVWPCAALRPGASSEEGSTLVPFHKLTGWLTYSLMEPLQWLLQW
ncbi:hypothetical protein C8J57DRAFT_1514470, partial [Mycena rebaudengoi]